VFHVFEDEEGGTALEIAFVGSGDDDFFEFYNIGVINLLQQRNLWNNQLGTSECGYGETLLLQFAVVVLQFLYCVPPPVLQALRLVDRAVGAPAHLVQDLVVVGHVVDAHHRPRAATRLPLLCITRHLSLYKII
jgi:hypothetical protein